MSITVVGGGNPSGPTYPLQRSVRMRRSASAYFNRTPASAGNRTTWTWSAWVKRGQIDSTTAQYFLISNNSASNDTGSTFVYFYQDTFRITGFNTSWRQTTQLFRDPSAWYHIVVVWDTTQATASNRVKIYVNGVQVTAFSVSNDPALNSTGGMNAATTTYMGADVYFGPANFFDGYITELNFIDGQALTPTSFGAYNAYGVWSPSKYTGTYGTNGFYLNFQDNSGATATTIGKDSSGNGNNWTPNNISVTAGVTYDSMVDVPTLTSGSNANFCVGNPNYVPSNNSKAVLSAGNLNWGNGGSNIVLSTAATTAMSSGKYYWEVTIGTNFPATWSSIGIQTDTNTAWRGGGTVLYRNDGQKIIGGTASAYGASYTAGDIIGFAYDATAGSLTCYKNNVSQGVIYSSGAGNNWLACMHNDNTASSYVLSYNFGQRPFTYTPPSGFKSLNTYNLPAPTIPNGAKYMGITLYTGNGGTQTLQHALYPYGGQPDLMWLKSRSAIANNGLFDSDRGWAKALYSNTTGAEVATAGVGGVDAANFTLGGDAAFNTNAATYVAWQWMGNSGTNVINTSGSIVSTISANTTAGFSIVTYTGNGSAGATVGHGLGIAPKMIILKNRSNATGYSWPVMHTSLPANGNVFLNLTQAYQTTYTVGGIANPANSSTFGFTTTSTLEQVNANTNTYVAYCWAEIPGFSKFGSYTGNGSTDGVFVYTGMRSRWLMIKRTDTADSWVVYDTSRSTFNESKLTLYPNLSNAESADALGTDILSNGFKMRNTYSSLNVNGATYIYAAFAENPFNYSLAR